MEFYVSPSLLLFFFPFRLSKIFHICHSLWSEIELSSNRFLGFNFSFSKFLLNFYPKTKSQSIKGRKRGVFIGRKELVEPPSLPSIHLIILSVIIFKPLTQKCLDTKKNLNLKLFNPLFVDLNSASKKQNLKSIKIQHFLLSKNWE